MIVNKIIVDGFKNLEEVNIEPHEKYNLITGMNAQGKTNLIEAVWLSTGCKSFRGSKEKDFICFDKDKMRIGVKFHDKRREQRITYVMGKENLRAKEILLNGVRTGGTGKLFEAFKCVVFTPDDTDLIKGGPEKRRSFVDLCSCQLKHNILDTVKRYDMLLNQRNALLKTIAAGKANTAALDVWNQQIAAIGTALCQYRSRYIEKLNYACSMLYSLITGGKEKLEIIYGSNIYGAGAENIENEMYAVGRYYMTLEEALEEDIRQGYTRKGAHRDDLLIKINGLNIKDFGSQGQKKTAALVLKLGQAEIYYKNQEEAPVILLDDVMGELDESRQKLVFEIIKNMQVFITACNENAVNGLSAGKHFRVANGNVYGE